MRFDPFVCQIRSASCDNRTVFRYEPKPESKHIVINCIDRLSRGFFAIWCLFLHNTQVDQISQISRTYTLSFGTEKYEYNASDNTFNPEEFHVYISDNGERWVELEYTFPNGFKNGRWDLASTTFTVPSGTSSLYVYFSSDLKSAHRIDDVALAVSSEAGTSIDFSKGTAIGGGETPDPEPGENMTIAEVIAASNGTQVQTTGQVMAKSTKGFVLSDETGNIFVYGDSVVGQVEIGSYATVSGAKDTYNNQPQIGNPAVSDVTGGTASYPEPQQLNGNESAIVSGPIAYVTWSGIITKSGKYYNFEIEGATRSGSVYYADPSVDLDSKVGVPVVMNGYYTSHSNTYLYVVPVSVTVDEGVSYLNISKTTQSVSAEAGSFTFDVSSNAAWTAESSDAAFSVSPASGNGDATVTVNYAENTSTESRTATITVKAGDIARTLTVSQSGVSAGGEVADELTADMFTATSSTYTSFSGVTATSPAVYAGQTAKNGNAIQLRSKNSNSGIVTTTSGGKLKKVRIVWNSQTGTDRSLDIYVSNTPYTDATELYKGNQLGEKIGSLNKGNGDTELEIVGDYQYVGVRSYDGAMYLDSIEFVWE